MSDWIKEINLRNEQRDTDEENKAYWAVTYLDHAYAAEWCNHKYILIREGKFTNQETLFRFIKGEYLEIGYQDLQVRETWWITYQRFSKTPEQFYTR